MFPAMMNKIETFGRVMAETDRSGQASGSVINLEPTQEQIERVQQIAYRGHSIAQMAVETGISETVLRRWSERQDEIGDALKVSRSIQDFRAQHEPEDTDGR